MRYLVALILMVSCSEWRASCFDYASACTRPYRSSRSRNAATAPCDLSKYNYCTTPGNSYPWHAIRRFVRENQGLMRRMYGEERHIAVLKAELENFIEDDDEDDSIKRQDFAEDIIKTKMKYSNKNTHGRGINMRPHFRPINSSNKKHDNDTLKVKPLEPRSNITKSNNTITNKTSETNEEKSISYKTKLESIANIEINNLDPEVITLETVSKQTVEKINMTPLISSKSDVLRTTENATLEKNDTLVNKSNNTSTTENISNTDTTTDKTNIAAEESTEADKDDWKPIISDTSTLPPTLLFSEHEKKNDSVEIVSDKKEDFPRKPSFQETLKPAVIKLKGANACETKEEMAAPFWANSTRGEVLALLNMYPFEQYIHMETCVHERKQMYCREGCRCEQQYRLHRLLAYDPRNDCRGIFADWFKFPGCCVCKCYDVPLEFRARSPRVIHPQYDEEVKRAIYEDVARDWYAMGYYDIDEDLL